MVSGDHEFISGRWLHLVAAVLILLSLQGAARAQTQNRNARVQELERRLEQRDQVIRELLQRVEVLEQRLGIDHHAAAPGDEAAEPSPPRRARAAGQATAEGAPGTVVVDERSAERALERSLTQEGALLLSTGVLEIEPGFSYARREDGSPSIVTSGNQLQIGETGRNADTLTGDLALRLGLPWDSQLEFGIPYRWRGIESVTRVGFAPTSVSHRSGAALGDVRLGLAKTLLHEGLWRPDLVGRVTWDTATGSRSDNGVGLGGGFNELRGSLTAIKRQDPLVFIGGLSYQYSFQSGRIRPGTTYAANFGSFLALSPETSLHFLLDWAYQGETRLDGSRVAGSDRTFGTFLLGGSTLLARGTLLNFSVGIGLTGDADDWSVSLSLPIRLDRPLF
jgi:hypothetical protein